MFVVAGTMLAGGPVMHAQDANRDVVATVSDIGTIVDRVEIGRASCRERV